MKAASKGQDIAQGYLSSNYKVELKKSITLSRPCNRRSDRLIVMEPNGRSSLALECSLLMSQVIRLTSTAFQQARGGNSYFGSVYFVRQSEPHMTFALPIEHFKRNIIGVLQAEVNLKYVWEVVSNIKPGKAGYAYVTNRSGDLIAHPDISLVLQQRNVAQLNQVKEPFKPAQPFRKQTRGSTRPARKAGYQLLCHDSQSRLGGIH